MLTSAQCFAENDYQKMTMLFGIDKLPDGKSDDYIESDIKQIFIHNGYKPRKLILEY